MDSRAQAAGARVAQQGEVLPRLQPRQLAVEAACISSLSLVSTVTSPAALVASPLASMSMATGVQAPALKKNVRPLSSVEPSAAVSRSGSRRGHR